jgi:hypothetical protein
MSDADIPSGLIPSNHNRQMMAFRKWQSFDNQNNPTEQRTEEMLLLSDHLLLANVANAFA